MFDKFTNRAKQVIKLAKKEAQRMNHNYLGTEHVLLGLLKLGQPDPSESQPDDMVFSSECSKCKFD